MLAGCMALVASLRRRPRLIGALGVLFVAALALFMGGAWMQGYLPVRSFNAAEWKDPPSSNTRLSMIDALLQTHDLKGMTRAEVVGLLGEPPATDYFRHWDLVYFLGPQRGSLRIDSEWLVLKLDENGRVAEWRVATD